MNPGGIVVAFLGIVLGCQVFGGNMLERLGIVPTTSGGSTGGTNKPAVATAPTGPSPAVLNA